MRFISIHDTYKLAIISETMDLIAKSRQQLPLNEDIDVNYAIKVLGNMAKIASYLAQTQLKNAGDDQRFEQFIAMVKKEVPNLTQVFDRMKLDTSNMTTLNQRHQVFR